MYNESSFIPLKIPVRTCVDILRTQDQNISSTKAAPKEDIPDIEEDEHNQQNTEHHHLITHNNTHQESEWIRQEYTEKLQDLDDQQYFQQVDKNLELIYYLP